ncbi:MAG: fructose-6-phosphate aldolase [Bacteroidetes bacterium MED-G17]|nr:MAG: fructose-6-phosphate aldolase [Bacteroidetes bacterium TMED39]PDH52380.1 MAG: fructose-6-phosphate aldolase [Bacteroidetes bacterium MED-G17]CAI8263492.1 MAG: Transaldolase [Bacteroidetes bacterium MED-G17]|tara:strand:+ start:5905 stop:6564 length:660 start_codon:yes stop_codon:yes gene_type:complete
MKFFIDTANLSEINEANELGILDGVTTNPSLMAKEGISGEEEVNEHYIKICNLVNGDISAEVISTNFEGMIIEGQKLAKLHENIVVKVPMIKDGVKAIKWFSDKGIRTNCTLVFSPGQAILAAKAGADYVSPFVGRIDDITWDGMELISQISDIYTTQGYHTEILAASIRTPKHIVESAELGADVITAPLKSILGLLNHPLTDIGLAKFLADHEKVSKS